MLRFAYCIAIVTLACGCTGDEKKPKETAPPTNVASDETPKNVPPAEMDVSFLVKPCVDSGIAAKACECAGEEAKSMIGPELLTKMGKAPKEGDPALASYYTRAEIGRIMEWVEGGAEKCGIEEEG